MKKYFYLFWIVIWVIAGFGCSNAPDAVSPANESNLQAASDAIHHTWGLWQFSADLEAETLEVVQLRTGNLHLNALPFLEPPPLVNLTLESVEFNGNIIEVDIGLRHPFLGLNEFTGFDVCGILIGNGSITGFEDPDLRMTGEGDTRLLNPDGYSRWWNPAEFPVNNGTIMGYTDGLLGAPDSHADYNSTLNAYKYFCDDLEPNDSLSNITLGNRGMFSAGQKNVRHYSLEIGTAGLIFNYAVDACWKYPTGGSPWTVPDDFPPYANRPEAWRISVTEIENYLWNDGEESGGDLLLQIDVYDWYNTELNSVTVESPGNFDAVTTSTPIGGGDGYSTYGIDIMDATPAPDSIDILISVGCEITGYGGLLPGTPVCAYFMHTSEVTGETPAECGEEVHEFVGEYNVTGVNFPDDHFLGDMTFMEVGPHAGKVLYQYADGRFGVISPEAEDQIMIPFNTESSHYANFNPTVDACPFSGRVFVGVRSYMDIYDSGGNLLGPFYDDGAKVMAAEIDDNGGLWALMRVGDEVRLRHYLYIEEAPYYQLPAAHDTDLSYKYQDSEPDTEFWCGVDMVMDFEKDTMFVFAAIWPPKANSYLITVFDISSGYAVELAERDDIFSGVFSVTPGGVSPFCYGRKADIEIDHSLAEYCRIVVSGIVWKDGAYHLELIRLDDDLTIMDFYDEYTGDDIVDMPLQFIISPLPPHPIIATPTRGMKFMYFHCDDW